jgi:hypothetical protein
LFYQILNKNQKKVLIWVFCVRVGRARGGIKENAEKKNKKNYLVKPNQ